MIHIEVDTQRSAIWYRFSPSAPVLLQKVVAVSSLAIDHSPVGGSGLLSKSHQQWLHQLGYHYSRIAMVQQVHGNQITIVDHPGEWGQGDGLITSKPNILLGIRTADCAAVFMMAQEVSVVALLHVGWRGIIRGIIPGAIQLLKQWWGITSRKLWIAVSPVLRGCCYRVTDEFLEYFPLQYFQRREGNWFFQFEFVLKKTLLAAGVPENQLIISPWCTKCGEYPLHSFRRDKTRQRMYHVIQISDNG